MTPEEFDAVERYNENYRYELIHGVLVVSPLPLAQETGPNELLGNLLFVYHEQNPQGTALDCTLPEQYIATADSRRRADRVLWAGLGRLPDLAAGPAHDRRRVRLRGETRPGPRITSRSGPNTWRWGSPSIGSSIASAAP
jgi:hypothetical protein